MTSISPSYYAAGATPSQYVLEGHGFLNIPADAVGLLSDSNNNPTEHRYQQATYRSYTIVVESDNRAVLTYNAAQAVNANTYLGCIVSPDGSVLYWENTTRPLP